MIRSIGLSFAALVALAGAPAHAHPHVWVTMQTELIYASDGTVTGLRHAWTFDDMFSEYATQGLQQQSKGQFTREELKPLAEENVTSLKEYDFFNHLKIDGKRTKDIIAEPTDYWLDYKDSVLTLNFTLPQWQEPSRCITFSIASITRAGN